MGLTGCGEVPQTVPEGTPKQEGVSLSCVERTAQGNAFVAAVETVTPRRGPLARASRYLNVRLRHGGHITITEWQSEAAEETAVRSYMSPPEKGAPQVSLESSGTRIKTLTAMSPNVGVSELQTFDRCGLDEP
jgi:hypothetical protein